MSGVTTFGVALEKVFTKNVDLPDALQVAVLHGRDDRLERLWLNRGRLGRMLVEAGYSSAITPGFSNYWEWSALDNLVMIAKAMEMIESMAEFIPVIPTITARNKGDLERWVGWLSCFRPSRIAIHFSAGGRHKTWDWLARCVRAASKLFLDGNWIPELVANGIGTMARMRLIAELWPAKVVFASQSPWQLANRGFALDSQLRRTKVGMEVSRYALESSNSAEFGLAVEKILGSELGGTEQLRA